MKSEIARIVNETNSPSKSWYTSKQIVNRTAAILKLVPSLFITIRLIYVSLYRIL